MNPDSTADTGDFTGQAREAEGSSLPSTRVDVRLSALSDPGITRENNEDCYLVCRFGRSLNTLRTNLPREYAPTPYQEFGYGMLVADGMGGPAAGEVASRTAIQTLVQLVLETPDWIFSAEGPYLESVLARMAERFRVIDQMLRQQAAENPGQAGMGTTLTLAASRGLDLIVCHIGDSRAYLFRDGNLEQLTRDMTMVQEMIDAGLVDPEEKRSHRARHILTQSLGSGIAEPDLRYRMLRDKDRLLMCTDGLTEMLKDGQIAEILGSTVDTDATCRRLVDRALQAGGRDNVTVVLADYRVP
jgi:protein phosphatase